MRANTKCRTCKAPIRWVRTMGGKSMPIDPEPVADGNLWVEAYDGGVPVVQVVLTHDDVPRQVPLTYVSHFVTCPDSAAWRKR